MLIELQTDGSLSRNWCRGNGRVRPTSYHGRALIVVEVASNLVVVLETARGWTWKIALREGARDHLGFRFTGSGVQGLGSRNSIKKDLRSRNRHD